MERVKRFVKFIELSTKLASLTPFFIGVAYVFYLTGRINVFYTLFFAADMMFFDLPVTMINNYLDKRRANETPHFSKAVSLTWIFSMTGLSFVMGLYLTRVFGPVVIMTGALCFFVGIFYSFGPIPISRTPYSEIASGLVQGFCVTFLTAFINLPQGYLVEARFDFVRFDFSANVRNMLGLVIVTLPAIFCIANIMLANNICDVERDTKCKRYSLPYYIGREKSLVLFRYIYAAAYASVLAGVLVSALPAVSLLVLLTFPLVWRNGTAFAKAPEKAKTFVLSIANFTYILYPFTITLVIGRFIG
ncbi:MAG: UbiA family prenyltransferase [Clostridiales bacterium]|jgi:1,4-dihydroxy-2-naphthoate octaprenyltransferase|nr:UbiA family prenyltransferase [Clostridiales bacterium]